MSAHEPRLFAEPNEDSPDEQLDVWMDGEVIMSVTYDEVGYAGMEKISRLVELISDQL